MTKPESVGISGERLTRIRPAIEKYIARDKIAGAVTLLARKGVVVHHEAYGLSSREKNTEMRGDSLFRIYSMTKPITTVAILSLMELGELQLIDPVSKYIPGIDDMPVVDGDRFTTQTGQMKIWHLLTHTAGFTYRGSPGRVGDEYRRLIRTSRTTLNDLIDGLLQTPLCFQPGSRYEYGFSLDVAARIVEIISGIPFDEFLKKTIFEPLAMNDTGFYVPPENQDRLTSMYGASNLDMETDPAETPEIIDIQRNQLLSDAESDYVSTRHSHFRGGHGLVSSTMDYYRFCEMLLRGGELDGARVLGKKTVELMRTNHLPDDLLPYSSGGMPQYGLGHGLGVRVMLDPGRAHTTGSTGEFGWGGAASTYFWIDPVEQFIGIQMAQYQPPLLYRIGSDFRNAAYQSIVD